MGLIHYFRIWKTLMLSLLFVCMDYVSNHNGKVLEETFACFNLDAVKRRLRYLSYFKMTLTRLQVLQKPLPIPLPLCHTQ